MQGDDSRPITPESPMNNSLDDLTNTIDDLTLALNNFSRVPSPEPPSLLTCCCQQEDCENLKAWQQIKSRMENRLILSAEIGQALLQRHEAYVRRHENCSVNDGNSSGGENGDLRLSELLREKHALEKLPEVSSKTLHQELQEARMTISRLSASHAKSVGWETRLSVVTKEKDDLQQERDFESQRARVAESRFAALKDKTSNLQSEVRRLQNELEHRRLLRLESTESLLQDARSRIQMLHDTIGSPSTLSEDSELTKVLESLVDDNEGLKRDNAELQHLLAESRDDLHALQQEVEEQRANMPINPPRSRAGTPLMSHFGRTHHYSGSMPRAPLMDRRNSSVERRSLRPEPLTPETLGHELPPLSPGDSEYRSARRYSPLPTSLYPFELDRESNNGLASPRTHKPLFLLTRSCAVQTDPQATGLSPSPIPSPLLVPTPSPHDPRSESSSFSESNASNMAILIDRVTGLLTRMSQADALTLTNRLKRQHLRGADVGHLSRSTIGNIINDIGGLRVQFRYLLEDENLVTMCTRKDIRALFKLFREFFVEMGAIRVTLNDVILDPSIAPKIAELALDPAKAEADKNREGATPGSWMAPISRLFSASTAPRTDAVTVPERASPAAAALGGLVRSTSARPQRFVPKLQPALSASATTVNVEFSSGVGRSVTSSSADDIASSAQPQRSVARRPSLIGSSSSSVLGIFAGAPQSPDPWVVVPKGPRRVQSNLHGAGSPVLFRRPDFGLGNRLSRNVDAVIDEHNTRSSPIAPGGGEDEETDVVGPLMRHTLRRRGLSDSSIHSTYMGDETMTHEGSATPAEPAWPSKSSVLQALSRKVQSFRSGITDVLPSSYDERSDPKSPSVGVDTREAQGRDRENAPTPRSISKRKSGRGFLPDISSWAPPENLDPSFTNSLMVIGSPPRDEAAMLRHRDRMDDEFGKVNYGRRDY
ncbi:hypothetical protein BDP27DRAFT_1328526 [Rhodocollybia butyracea]|uniref:Uncharacterized protein n=1 Tax=Rhodocollybia butyracea TaxID=206335 RepID=A0A9P5PL70_9AGAR|nr:hypothetical protein BDP27DRAFT_1328526 [Rhodocollybia butyracea]